MSQLWFLIPGSWVVERGPEMAGRRQEQVDKELREIRAQINLTKSRLVGLREEEKRLAVKLAKESETDNDKTA